MNNENIQGWEKEFDIKAAKSIGEFVGGDKYIPVSWVKFYISTLLTQTRKEEREEMRKVMENMSYVGVLDSNEKRRGYDIAREEALSALNKRDE